MDYEHFKVFDLINNFTKFSDTKAGVIVAFNMSILGVVLNNLKKFNVFSDFNCFKFLYILSLGLFFISTLLSILNALISVHPSLKAEGNKSNIFFAHIAGKDLKNFTDEISNKIYSYETDLISQIKINSDICWKKYIRVSWAMKFTIVSICSLVVSIIFILTTKV